MHLSQPKPLPLKCGNWSSREQERKREMGYCMWKLSLYILSKKVDFRRRSSII